MISNVYVIQDSISHNISDLFTAPNEPTAFRIFDGAVKASKLPKKLRRDTDLLYLGTLEVADDGKVFLCGFEHGSRVCSADDPCFDDDEDDEVEA